MGTGSTRGAGRDGPRATLSARARPAALALLLASAALLPATSRATDPPREPLQSFPQSDLVVEAGGKAHRFRVWVAATEPRREQGLMWVRELKADRGMLFVFDAPQSASFWMKNTLIPLDLLFIGADGRIIRIAENATPLSLAAIQSMGVVRGVLEVAGGSCARLGIRTGDRIRHPALVPS
jgi:uncharacterized membrane protein (UPF0127 family)